MSNHHHSQYVYNAAAYGFAAEFEQPAKHSIPTQAGTVLSAAGGRGSARVRDFKFDGIISVADAYCEVGGHYDEDHKLHATYAFSALEKVNVADVFSADRIVSRMTIYAKQNEDPRFDITGSHFENVKIAGHKVEVKLATDVFHKLQQYSDVGKGTDKWQAGSKLGELTEKNLEDLAPDYHGLPEMVAVIKASKAKGEAQDGRSYLLSPANHLQFKDLSSEILCFGNMIFIPKFGYIRLAELVVNKHCRSLIMFNVQMCSGSLGGANGGSSGGSGGVGG